MMSAPANQYLLEIGTEELPAGFLATAPNELADKTRQALAELGITPASVNVLATPRRLALMISGLPNTQADREQVLKGPPVRIGLDASAKPTPAAIGFARKSGIDPALLKQEIIDGEDYLVYRQMICGKPVQALLPELLPALVLGLSGSHFMTWGDYDIKFSRPIRWLLSLWNTEHLPLSIGPVVSGKITYGHRVLSNGPIEIDAVSAYVATLQEKGFVWVDQAQRRAMVWAALEQAASQHQGCVQPNEALLETVTMLVESPSIVVGNFQERFLAVPAEVTTTVMASHQKYFPLHSKTGELMPHFLTVSNGRVEAAENIRLGNEKVITARLEDARFFFEEDQKVSLADRLEKLKGVTFQKGMGSMFDKTQRLIGLSEAVSAQLNQIPAFEHDLALSKRAATLAKADLVTSMVFEFTELQGVMGQKYALLQKEPAAVATGIYEHYLPRFNGDEVASSPVGIAVSLADKIDSIVCVFAQENAKLPTGSKDPMGLRRMALGILQTVLQNQVSLDITALLKAAYVQLGPLATATEETMLGRVREFMLQRLKVNWLEDSLRHDVIDAVLETGLDPLTDLLDAYTRLGVIKTLLSKEKQAQLKSLYEPANRIAKILGERYSATASFNDIQPALCVDASEKALLEMLTGLLQSLPPGHAVGSTVVYQSRINALSTLSVTVERFFDAVLVNDPDEAVRKNRYNLLSVIQTQYLCLANFSKLMLTNS